MSEPKVIKGEEEFFDVEAAITQRIQSAMSNLLEELLVLVEYNHKQELLKKQDEKQA